MVERSAVNRLVVGSNPTARASCFNRLWHYPWRIGTPPPFGGNPKGNRTHGKAAYSATAVFKHSRQPDFLGHHKAGAAPGCHPRGARAHQTQMKSTLGRRRSAPGQTRHTARFSAQSASKLWKHARLLRAFGTSTRTAGTRMSGRSKTSEE